MQPLKPTPQQQRLQSFWEAQDICASGRPNVQHRGLPYHLSPSYWTNAIGDEEETEQFLSLGYHMKNNMDDDTLKIVNTLIGDTDPHATLGDDPLDDEPATDRKILQRIYARANLLMSA